MGWLIDKIATLYIIVIIVRWAIEFFAPQYENTGWFLRIKDVTEPLLKTIRNLVPKLGNFDFSYIIAILGVRIVSKILTALL